MRPIKAFFATPFERRMTGDEHAVFEDADRVGEDVQVQNAAAVVSGTLYRLPPTQTMPSCDTRRSSLRTAG